MEERIDKIEKKNHKKKGGILAFIAIMVVMVIGVVGCSAGGLDDTQGVELTSSSFTCEWDDFFEEWETTVTGTIKNTSNSDYSYVSVEFSLYDADGVVIGTATASESNLSAGETWRFTATDYSGTDEKVVSIKLKDITSW